MSVTITEEEVLKTLSSLTISGQIHDLVATGLVSGVVVKNGHIGFSLEVDPNHVEKAIPSSMPLRMLYAHYRGFCLQPRC